MWPSRLYLTLSHLSSPKPPRCFATSSVTSMKTTRSGLQHGTMRATPTMNFSCGSEFTWGGQHQAVCTSWDSTQALQLRMPHRCMHIWVNNNRRSAIQDQERTHNLSMIMFVPAAKLLWICFSFSHLRNHQRDEQVAAAPLKPVGREEEVDCPVIKLLTASQVRVDHRSDACATVREPGVYPGQ